LSGRGMPHQHRAGARRNGSCSGGGLERSFQAQTRRLAAPCVGRAAVAARPFSGSDRSSAAAFRAGGCRAHPPSHPLRPPRRIPPLDRTSRILPRHERCHPARISRWSSLAALSPMRWGRCSPTGRS